MPADRAGCRALLVVCALALACAGSGGAGAPEPAAPPPAHEGKLHAMGVLMGESIADMGLSPAEIDVIARGFVDGALDRVPEGLIDLDKRREVQEFARARIAEQQRIEEQAGAGLLERAAREPGAVTLDGGIVMNVIEPGVGEPPKPSQIVTLLYEGTLRDGRVALATPDGPRTFKFDTTIRCWKEALGRVAPGARLRVVCPPAVTFGSHGLGDRVPGGAVVSFELELLEVSDPE